MNLGEVQYLAETEPRKAVNHLGYWVEWFHLPEGWGAVEGMRIFATWGEAVQATQDAKKMWPDQEFRAYEALSTKKNGNT